MAAKIAWVDAMVKPPKDGVYEVSRVVWNFKLMWYERFRHKLDFRDGNWHYTKRARMAAPGSLASMKVGDLWRPIAAKD